MRIQRESATRRGGQGRGASSTTSTRGQCRGRPTIPFRTRRTTPELHFLMLSGKKCAPSVSTVRITHFAHTFQNPVHTFPNLVHTDSPSFAPCYHLYQNYAKSVDKVWITHFGHTFQNLVHTFGVLFRTMSALFPTLYTLIFSVLHFVITIIKSTPKVRTKYDLHTLDTLFSILYTLFCSKFFKCAQSV